MIVLPIMDSNIIVKINLNFKNTNVLKNQLDPNKDGSSESDIIIGKYRLNSFNNDEIKKINSNPLAVTNFIRRNINYVDPSINNIKVNTKKYPNSDFYDTYILPLPNYNENEVNDYIYGLLINNVRCSMPNLEKQEKLDLSKLNIDNIITTSFLNKTIQLKHKSINSEELKHLLIKEGYQKQVEIIDFINSLDYEINNKEIALVEDFDTLINFFNDGKKEQRSLINYKNIAKTNYDMYISLGAFNNILYDRPLEWHNLSKEQQKILQLRLNNKKYKEAA